MTPRGTRELGVITDAAAKSRFCRECGNPKKDGQHFCDRCLALLPPNLVHGLAAWRSSAAAYTAAVWHLEQNPTPSRPMIGKPVRLLGGRRKAYRYHNDFDVGARLDCNFRMNCSTLADAIAACELRRDKDPRFSVHVDCTFDGVIAIAHVGLGLAACEGKSEWEIWHLLDLEVDGYIASRVNTGHWHPWRAPDDSTT